MKETDLFIFRHGETDWNKERKLQGHTDIPLNAQGILQAQGLHELIRPFSLQGIVSSDLSRARATAELANRSAKAPLFLSPELRECHLGDVEGMPFDRLMELHGPDSWQRWLSIHPDDFNYAFPNGEAKDRHLDRLVRYLENFCLTNAHYQRLGVSTHGGCLRRLIHFCEGAPHEPVPLPNCALYRVKFLHEGSRWIYVGRIEAVTA